MRSNLLLSLLHQLISQVLVYCWHLPVVYSHTRPITCLLVCEYQLGICTHRSYHLQLTFVLASMLLNEVLDVR